MGWDMLVRLFVAGLIKAGSRHRFWYRRRLRLLQVLEGIKKGGHQVGVNEALDNDDNDQYSIGERWYLRRFLLKQLK